MNRRDFLTGYHPAPPCYYSGRGTVLATRANLPHWSKAQTATFVTFRLADSLPEEKRIALEDERKAWLAQHPQPWDETTTRDYYARFDAHLQEWLDAGYGACVLADDLRRRLVEDVLAHFAGERYELYAFVVMPNHVHVLFQPTGEWSMSEIVASWKKFAAREINQSLGREGPLWQKESFDTLVRSERHFRTIVSYIKRNDLAKAWVWEMGER